MPLLGDRINVCLVFREAATLTSRMAVPLLHFSPLSCLHDHSDLLLDILRMRHAVSKSTLPISLSTVVFRQFVIKVIINAFGFKSFVSYSFSCFLVDFLNYFYNSSLLIYTVWSIFPCIFF